MIHNSGISLIANARMDFSDIYDGIEDNLKFFSQLCRNEIGKISIEDTIVKVRYNYQPGARGIYRISKQPMSIKQVNAVCSAIDDNYIVPLSRVTSHDSICTISSAYGYEYPKYKDNKEEEMVGRRVVKRKITEKSNDINNRINTKIDRLLSRTETKLIKKLKTHFGIEFSIRKDRNDSYIQFNSWLVKYDKNFTNHILEPQKMDPEAKVYVGSISEEIIVKLDSATYVYVRPENIYKEDIMLTRNEPSSSLYVYIFGKKCIKYAKELSKILKESPNIGSTGILYTVTAHSENNWNCICQDINMRSFDNLFFEDEVQTSIIDHLENWKSNESIYLGRDIMFKTGILLYGKAGTGKSSMATAIAKYMNCNIITIDLNTFDKLDISSFVSAINADKTRYVVLLDEIDTIFTSREKKDSTETQTSNTMKLLSLLDSPQSPNNVIFVATTNYIDRLDNALTRKGRFDLKLKLSDFGDEVATKMCKSFGLNALQTDEAKQKAGGGPSYNPAILQDSILNVIQKK